MAPGGPWAGCAAKTTRLAARSLTVLALPWSEVPDLTESLWVTVPARPRWSTLWETGELPPVAALWVAHLGPAAVPLRSLTVQAGAPRWDEHRVSQHFSQVAGVFRHRHATTRLWDAP
jgi:hypothetical protein